MANYRIVFARSAERDLHTLPQIVQQRAMQSIDALATAPRPAGVEKIVGTADLWRIRVGDYRIIYRIDDRERLIDVTHIRHRKDVYA